MAEIRKDDIPYDELSLLLFPDHEFFRGQTVVPFLGAGASLQSVLLANAMNPPAFPSKTDVEKVLTCLGFQDHAHKRERTVVLFSLALGYLMIHSQTLSSATDVTAGDLINDTYPPSSARLADFFAGRLNYDYVRQLAEDLMAKWPVDWNEPGQEDARKQWVRDLQHCFNLLIEATRLHRVKDSLTSIAALYENSAGRTRFWGELATIFENKRAITKTHQLVARAAKHHLAAAKHHLANVSSDASYLSNLSKLHYLVVTTNYDCLIEEALGDSPWVVLYFEKKIPPASGVSWEPTVSTRFSPLLLEKSPSLPGAHDHMCAKEFVLNVDQPIVVILKIHGTVFPQSAGSDDKDSVIISDFDYEDFLTIMGRSAHLMLPVAATTLMAHRSFLFLGYSLADWNIRTILTAIKRRRAEGETAPDYAVMNDISQSAEAYCTRRKIRILQTTLDSFADECNRKSRIAI